MTAQDTPVEDTTTTEETPKSTKKFSLGPVAKKVLVWGGAALGIITVVAIAAAARQNDDEDREIYVLTELPDATLDETPAVTD
jgi:hypothetical protein